MEIHSASGLYVQRLRIASYARLTIDHWKFQTVLPQAQSPVYDGILGMTFCKRAQFLSSMRWILDPQLWFLFSLVSNVYLVLNYGDLIDGNASKSDPYVQMLSTTDPTEAHADFVATRQGLTNTTVSPYFNGSGSSKKNFFQTYRNVIFALAAVVLCIM